MRSVAMNLPSLHEMLHWHVRSASINGGKGEALRNAVTISLTRAASHLGVAALWITLAQLPAAETQAGATPHDPLFSSHEPLSITLKGPFKDIDKRRDKEAEYAPGSLSYDGPDGTVSIETTYRPRGNFRLDKKTCSRAQLWLDLKKKQTSGTEFAHQHKLKLVVQCRGSKRYSEYLRKEYLAYRMLNVLTDVSYRVRWVNVTYQDLSGKTLWEKPAFFIEHKKRLADRQNLMTVDDSRISRDRLDPEQSTMTAMFSYFVGNADFSLVGSREGSCCHNAKLFQEDADATYLPVVYDFDSSGLVSAAYASPPAKLKLRSVRERLYRGYCVEEDVFEVVLNDFRDERETLLAIANEPEIMGKRTAKRAVSYLEDFYKIIDNPKKLNREILEACR